MAVSEDTASSKAAIHEWWVKVDETQEDRMQQNMRKGEYPLFPTDNKETICQKRKIAALYGDRHYSLEGEVHKNLLIAIITPEVSRSDSKS
ncbi:hypothetical protein [Selenomonas noxia]|jgi:hypothetical protein|uniref:hypothetical protein n=1 Tax=Selenomonas noxia TaxID=135083 RepID=UPI0028808A41|nr:hypothetical protein [Selenomonas noxia]